MEPLPVIPTRGEGAYNMRFSGDDWLGEGMYYSVFKVQKKDN
jgi:hypothetical protein